MITQKEIKALFQASAAKRRTEKAYKEIKDDLSARRNSENQEAGTYVLLEKSRHAEIFDREAFLEAYPELKSKVERYTKARVDKWIEAASAAADIAPKPKPTPKAIAAAGAAGAAGAADIAFRPKDRPTVEASLTMTQLAKALGLPPVD